MVSFLIIPGHQLLKKLELILGNLRRTRINAFTASKSVDQVRILSDDIPYALFR